MLHHLNNVLVLSLNEVRAQPWELIQLLHLQVIVLQEQLLNADNQEL